MAGGGPSPDRLPLRYRPPRFALLERADGTDDEAINGAFFNAQRMVEQYAQSAYRIGASSA
jgi:hypothetical protein